jgi:hypothetical protein
LDPAQPAGALGDQESAIRQQRDRPWMLQPAGDFSNADIARLRLRGFGNLRAWPGLLRPTRR